MPDAAEYPPARHVLRDLRVTTEMGRGLEARAFLDVPDPLLGPGGTPHAGALATVVDMLGGGLAATAAQPDWIATADLTLHLLPASRDQEGRGDARPSCAAVAPPSSSMSSSRATARPSGSRP